MTRRWSSQIKLDPNYFVINDIHLFISCVLETVQDLFGDGLGYFKSLMDIETVLRGQSLKSEYQLRLMSFNDEFWIQQVQIRFSLLVF